jgi:hypothetical protein
LKLALPDIRDLSQRVRMILAGCGRKWSIWWLGAVHSYSK